MEGKVLSGRFKVSSSKGSDALGSMFYGQDLKANRDVLIRMLPPEWINDTTHAALKQSIKDIATHVHPALLGSYGVGLEAPNLTYVVLEANDGMHLSDWLVKFVGKMGPLESIPMLNISRVELSIHIGLQLLKALGMVHRSGIVHGGIEPSSVLINPEGKIKLINLGLIKTLLQARGAAELGLLHPAPEVQARIEPMMQTDIYGVGQVIAHTAFGTTVFSNPTSDSQEALIQVLKKALQASPQERYASAEAFQEGLEALLRKKDSIHPEMLIDLDDVLVSEALRRSMVPSPLIKQESATLPMTPHTPARSTGDLREILQNLAANDAPRWMVTSRGMDHGPLMAKDVVQSILTGEFTEDDSVYNMDTGEKSPLPNAPEFKHFIHEYQAKKQTDKRNALTQKAISTQKRNATLSAAVAMGLLTLVLGGVGAYLYFRPKDQSHLEGEALAELYDRGTVKIKSNAQLLDEGRGGRRGGRGGGNGGGNGGGAGSYEEAMNQVVNLGDISQGGGNMSRLSPDQVASTMNRHINSMYSCVSKELRSGGNLGNVRIQIAIAGSGQVLGSSTSAGSKEFQSCIQGKVRQVKFPSFGAPRMGASFSFSAN